MQEFGLAMQSLNLRSPDRDAPKQMHWLIRHIRMKVILKGIQLERLIKSL